MPVDVSIAVTRYDEPNGLIARSLQHALAQTGVCGEVIFIEQNDSPSLLVGEAPSGLLDLRIIRRRLGGLSEARNLALDEARNSFVLFLDADAMADADWARNLAAVLSKESCAVAGGKVVPGWPGKAPLFARASVLRDQYSVLDLGDGTSPYHRIVGAGFGLDMTKLPPDFRFDVTLGRRSGKLFGGEESDFCNRVRELGLQVFYVGSARVVHLVEPARCRWRWILKRMIYAGHGRARLGGSPRASGTATIYDWLIMPVYLPFYVLGWIWGKLGRDGSLRNPA